MCGGWPNHSAHLKRLSDAVSRIIFLLILQGNEDIMSEIFLHLHYGYVRKYYVIEILLCQLHFLKAR
jgi:hypothetical protein